MQTIGPGEVVGWSWFFAPYRWSFDARCQEAVTAYSFDGFCLRARCQADAALGYELMKRFAEVVVQRVGFFFHRPITLIQNSTDALLIDLLQCALGKKWHHPTELVKVAFPAIYDALTDPHKEKVAVVCHSQGTIVMADVLRLLKAIPREPVAAGAEAEFARMAGPEFVYPEDAPLDLTDFDPLEEHQLAKLEIYAFATCADEMTYYRAPAPGVPPIPRIEYFGNENDLVARLGMFAPRPDLHNIRIDGPRYENPDTWGHLLNAHYLAPIHKAQRPARKRGGLGGRAPFFLVNNECCPGPSPRLFGYLNGGRPGPDLAPSHAF